MSAFVRDYCDQGADLEVIIEHLYNAYQDWCHQNGMKPLPTQLFGRDLHAVLPGLHTLKPHRERRRYVGIDLKAPNWARNSYPSGSSGSSGAASSSGPDQAVQNRSEPHEPHETPLQPHIDEFLAQQDGRCPECAGTSPRKGTVQTARTAPEALEHEPGFRSVRNALHPDLDRYWRDRRSRGPALLQEPAGTPQNAHE